MIGKRTAAPAKVLNSLRTKHRKQTLTTTAIRKNKAGAIQRLGKAPRQTNVAPKTHKALRFIREPKGLA